MAQDPNSFIDFNPKQAEGPFINEIMNPNNAYQSQQSQGVRPSGYMGGLGKTAMMLDSFFGGVSKGRAMKLMKQENSKLQNWQMLTNRVNAILPTLSEEGQRAVKSKYFEYMGLEGQATLGHKDAKGVEDMGMPGKALGVAKHIFEGMTGGPAPKEKLKDVDPGDAMLDIEKIIHQNPTFVQANAEDALTKQLGQMTQRAKELNIPQETFRSSPEFTTISQKLMRTLGPQNAEPLLRSSVGSLFSQGSLEWADRDEELQRQKQQQQSKAGLSGYSVAGPNGIHMPIPQPPPPPPVVSRASLANAAQQGTLSKHYVRVPGDPNIHAAYTTGDNKGYYDQATRQQLPNAVETHAPTAPKEVPWQTKDNNGHTTGGGGHLEIDPKDPNHSILVHDYTSIDKWDRPRVSATAGPYTKAQAAKYAVMEATDKAIDSMYKAGIYDPATMIPTLRARMKDPNKMFYGVPLAAVLNELDLDMRHRYSEARQMMPQATPDDIGKYVRESYNKDRDVTQIELLRAQQDDAHQAAIMDFLSETGGESEGPPNPPQSPNVEP